MTYALMTGALAAVAAMFLGGPLIEFLRARKLGKAISADGPESHLSKAGTPTMGGLLFIGVALATGIVAAFAKDGDLWLLIAVTAVLAVIGGYDDLGTLIDRESRAAHNRTGMFLKLGAFAVISVVAGVVLANAIEAPRLIIPNDRAYDIPVWLYVVIVAGVFVSTTSAVGVSDGLDMLLGSTAAIAFSAYGAIALMQDQTGVAAFSFGLAGALVGFLWWNAYPARLFMGDTGSLPLGGALAIVALMTGWWLLLPIIGVVFVAAAASDVIQIGSYRLRGGKRVFKMAPLHHHFEELGWHEVSITARFAAVAVVGALVGVALAAW